MVEIRAKIKNIAEARKEIESLGAVFGGGYEFKDIILSFKMGEEGLTNCLRLRIYVKNNWPTKKAVLTQKKTEINSGGKTSKIVFKKEFNSEKEAIDFSNKEFSALMGNDFKYSREGWEYNLEGCRIFVENIKSYGLTIEIEGDSVEKIRSLHDRIGIEAEINDSTPEVMMRVFKNIKTKS